MYLCMCVHNIKKKQGKWRELSIAILIIIIFIISYKQKLIYIDDNPIYTTNQTTVMV